MTIEKGKFVHEAVRTYFTLQGALKEHCGLAWHDANGSKRVNGLAMLVDSDAVEHPFDTIKARMGRNLPPDEGLCGRPRFQVFLLVAFALM